MEKDIGNTHVLAKENSFSAEQMSRMVSESVTSSSSCVVSKKVSSTSVVSSSVSSSSETSLSQVKSITFDWTQTTMSVAAVDRTNLDLLTVNLRISLS